MADEQPVGVRPVTGRGHQPLVWAAAAGLSLQHGDRVLVADAEQSWLARVVVVPQQIVESIDLGPVPRVVRLATEADGWPSPPAPAGAALLAELRLPPEPDRPAEI